MTTSRVSEHGGVPTLFVNDKPITAVAYMTYFTSNNRYSNFSQAGFRLFSMPVFFASQTINEISKFPPFMPGIFDNGEHFDIFDNEVRRILNACPDAMIFPRVNCSLPREWEDAHPDELCDTRRRSCFSSELWIEETERLLTKFVRHVQSMDYADNIIGYQIAGGNTEEWLPFDQNGSVGLRAREKYARLTGKLYQKGEDYSHDRDFYALLSRTVAERIDRLASHTKKLVNGKQIVGTFYGYTLECPTGCSGHLALGELLRSDSIDFICSPISYMENRPFGIDHPCMLPVDSLKLHGKLYFAEHDTRTDLSRPPNDQPHYNKAIWFGPDRSTSLEVIKQHFCRSLTHGHAMWWFDMWGGWFDAPEYMSLLTEALEISASSISLSMKSTAEVAIFIDESAMLTYDATDEAYYTRHAFGLMGAAYDVYLANDFAAVSDKYKFIIFIEPTKTELMANAIENCHCPYLVINKDNCKISATQLRELLITAGVLLRSENDAIVYENESYIFIGGNTSPLVYDGEVKLLLDGIGRLYLKVK